MNREQMVEKGVLALCDALEAGGFGNQEPELWMVDMTAVLDALLPQVTTVAELEALPEFTIVVGSGPDGDVWSRIPGPMLWAGAGCEQPDTSEHVVEWGAPLTVVWQPEVTS